MSERWSWPSSTVAPRRHSRRTMSRPTSTCRPSTGGWRPPHLGLTVMRRVWPTRFSSGSPSNDSDSPRGIRFGESSGMLLSRSMGRRSQLWFRHRFRRLRSDPGESEIMYWRDKDQHELDFVLPGGRGKVAAIECKWDATRFEPKNLQGLPRAPSGGTKPRRRHQRVQTPHPRGRRPHRHLHRPRRPDPVRLRAKTAQPSHRRGRCPCPE